MNPKLDLLHAYPFEQLNRLLETVTPSTEHKFIPLSLGEPKHAAPDFLIDLFTDESFIRKGIGSYPPTKGLIELRQSIAGFINRRFLAEKCTINPETQILPVSGSREALFSFAQAIIDVDNISQNEDAITLIPNPFYQIYEGAALLAGSKVNYLACEESTDFIPDFDQVSPATWEKCQLVYICTPGNPSGSVMKIPQLQQLIKLSDTYNFVIASDECYSEVFSDEDHAPPGILQAAAAMERFDFKNCIAFNSLSKRSNLPGLRSGYVAGDSNIIEKFLLYRTYHGSAMSTHNQLLSAKAWNDEQHVIDNRALYREKYEAVLSILTPVWPMQKPPASFYLWPKTPVSDLQFTQKLLQHCNIKVLPGSYLSRSSEGTNPGASRVRMALVATLDECVEAAERIKVFMQKQQYL